MEVINSILPTSAPFENVLGTARKNEDPDGEEHSHDCPEERHEDDTTLTVEDSNKD